MDAKLIEKLDRARYNAWIVGTIGLAIWGGAAIFNISKGGQLDHPSVAFLAGLAIFLAGAVWKMLINRKTRSDSTMQQALNNELYIQYYYKAYAWAFWAMLVSLIVLIYADLDTKLTCVIALYAGVLVHHIAVLVYFGGRNRSKK